MQDGWGQVRGRGQSVTVEQGTGWREQPGRQFQPELEGPDVSQLESKEEVESPHLPLLSLPLRPPPPPAPRALRLLGVVCWSRNSRFQETQGGKSHDTKEWAFPVQTLLFLRRHPIAADLPKVTQLPARSLDSSSWSTPCSHTDQSEPSSLGTGQGDNQSASSTWIVSQEERPPPTLIHVCLGDHCATSLHRRLGGEVEAKRKLPPDLGKLGVHGPSPLPLELYPTRLPRTHPVRQLPVLCVLPPLPGGHRELVSSLRGPCSLSVEAGYRLTKKEGRGASKFPRKISSGRIKGLIYA